MRLSNIIRPNLTFAFELLWHYTVLAFSTAERASPPYPCIEYMRSSSSQNDQSFSSISYSFSTSIVRHWSFSAIFPAKLSATSRISLYSCNNLMCRRTACSGFVDLLVRIHCPGEILELRFDLFSLFLKYWQWHFKLLDFGFEFLLAGIHNIDEHDV